MITDVADYFGIFHIISNKAAQHKTRVSQNRIFPVNKKRTMVYIRPANISQEKGKTIP